MKTSLITSLLLSAFVCPLSAMEGNGEMDAGGQDGMMSPGNPPGAMIPGDQGGTSNLLQDPDPNPRDAIDIDDDMDDGEEDSDFDDAMDTDDDMDDGENKDAEKMVRIEGMAPSAPLS